MKTPSFLGELIRRFIAKTPEHYKVFQYLLLALTILTGIPAALEMYQIQLPETIAPFASKVFALSSAGLAFLVQFASVNPQIPPHEESENDPR